MEGGLLSSLLKKVVSTYSLSIQRPREQAPLLQLNIPVSTYSLSIQGPRREQAPLLQLNIPVSTYSISIQGPRREQAPLLQSDIPVSTYSLSIQRPREQAPLLQSDIPVSTYSLSIQGPRREQAPLLQSDKDHYVRLSGHLATYSPPRAPGYWLKAPCYSGVSNVEPYRTRHDDEGVCLRDILMSSQPILID